MKFIRNHPRALLLLVIIASVSIDPRPATKACCEPAFRVLVSLGVL